MSSTEEEIQDTAVASDEESSSPPGSLIGDVEASRGFHSGGSMEAMPSEEFAQPEIYNALPAHSPPAPATTNGGGAGATTGGGSSMEALPAVAVAKDNDAVVGILGAVTEPPAPTDRVPPASDDDTNNTAGISEENIMEAILDMLATAIAKRNERQQQQGLASETTNGGGATTGGGSIMEALLAAAVANDNDAVVGMSDLIEALQATAVARRTDCVVAAAVAKRTERRSAYEAKWSAFEACMDAIDAYMDAIEKNMYRYFAACFFTNDDTNNTDVANGNGADVEMSAQNEAPLAVAQRTNPVCLNRAVEAGIVENNNSDGKSCTKWKTVYAFLFVAPYWSKPVQFAHFVIFFKMLCYGVVSWDRVFAFDSSQYSQVSNLHFKFSIAVKFILIPVAVAMQEDLIQSFSATKNGYYYDPEILETYKWATKRKYKYAVVMRFFDGLYSVAVNISVMVDTVRIFDVFMSFAALHFLRSIDNIFYELATMGFFGEDMEDWTMLCNNVQFPRRRQGDEDKKCLGGWLKVSQLDSVCFGISCLFCCLYLGPLFFSSSSYEWETPAPTDAANEDIKKQLADLMANVESMWDDMSTMIDAAVAAASIDAANAAYGTDDL